MDGVRPLAVTLLSVGVRPQQDSPRKVLLFREETAFPVRSLRFAVIFHDFQRNNTQAGGYPLIGISDSVIVTDVTHSDFNSLKSLCF